MDKAALGAFLARNPFPKGLTDGLFYREKMRAIHRVAPDRLCAGEGVARILDLGGGRSGLAAMLYPRAEVTTLDLDFDLHDQGPARTSFVCGDACALPFADGTFDAVALFDVLEHIADDRAAAAEALRVTRPGGWVLASTPDADWRYPYYGFMQPVCPPESELMAEWGHVRRGYGREALEDLFGGPPARSSSFINGLTALFHDISFSRLGRRKRRIAYLAAAPFAALGYGLHRPAGKGAERAFVWRR